MYSNRLDFSKMVDKKFTASEQPPQVFFETQFITPNKMHGSDEELPEHPKPVFPKTSIDTSWKSILNQMHSKLRARRPITFEEPLSSILEDATEDAKGQGETSAALVAATKSQTEKNGNKTKSIPQLKANVQLKGQQRTRRVVGKPNDLNNYTNQKRIKEVLRQKRLLEDMLAQHQRLERDRRTIAHEIQVMRSHVNEIREKLDSSMKKLKANPTVFATSTNSKRYTLAVAASKKAKQTPGTMRRNQRIIPLTKSLIN